MALCGACNLIIRPPRQLLGSYSRASASRMITLGGQWAAGSSRETEGWETKLHPLPSLPRSDSGSGQ